MKLQLFSVFPETERHLHPLCSFDHVPGAILHKISSDLLELLELMASLQVPMPASLFCSAELYTTEKGEGAFMIYLRAHNLIWRNQGTMAN